MRKEYDRRPSGLLVPAAVGLFAGHYVGKIIRHETGEIEEFEADNLIVNQGLDHILGVEFAGVAQITAWFLAPFTGNYVPVATDTAASISANSTECTAYTSPTRVAYTAAENAQQV